MNWAVVTSVKACIGSVSAEVVIGVLVGLCSRGGESLERLGVRYSGEQALLRIMPEEDGVSWGGTSVEGESIKAKWGGGYRHRSENGSVGTVMTKD